MSTRKTLVGALYTIIQPLLLSAVGLPATAYVIRSLGPDRYGQWAVGVSLVAMASVLTSLGLRPLFIRRVAQEPEAICEEAAYQLGLRSLLALGAATLVVLLCVCLKYPATVLICTSIMALGLILTTLGGVLEDILQGHQRLKTVAMINMISGIVLTTLSVIAAWRGGGPIGVTLAYLAGPIIYFLSLSCIVQKQFFPLTIRWSSNRFSQLIKETRLLGAAMLISTLRDRAEQLFVPKLLGMTSFGFFTAGSLLADRLTVLPSGLSVAFFPLIARTHKEHQAEASRHATRLIILVLAICLPTSILITFLADPIAQFLFPKNAPICRDMIRLTIWSLPLMGVWVSLGFSLQAANAHNEGARASMMTSLFSIVIAFILTSRFGLKGACLSLLLRSIIGIIIYIPVFGRTFPNALRQLPLARVLICAVIMLMPLLILTKFSVSSPYSTGIGILFALLIYSGGLLFLQVMRVSDLLKLIENKGT